MKQTNTQYDFIRQEYPKFISKDQFYRIAHISKATALYLLQSGHVPCINSGKKTRKYKILTEDVIQYLIDRNHDPLKYKAEPGWYSHRSRAATFKNRTPHSELIFDYSALSQKKALCSVLDR